MTKLKNHFHFTQFHKLVVLLLNEIKLMNKLAIILSHLKENKAFYVILVLNFAISFGLLYFIDNYDLIEHRIEIREDINKGHKALDSLCSEIHYKSNRYLSETSEKNEKSNKGIINLKCQYYEN